MQFATKSMQQFSGILAMMDSTVRDSVRDEADIQRVLGYYSPIKGLKIDVTKHDQQDFWTYTCQSSHTPAPHQSNIQKGERQQSASPRTPVGGPVDYDALQRAPSRRPAPPSLSRSSRNPATNKAATPGVLSGAISKLVFDRGHDTPTGANRGLYSLFPRPPIDPSTPVGGSIDYEAILRAPKIRRREAHKPIAIGDDDFSFCKDEPAVSTVPFKRWAFNTGTLQLTPSKPCLTVDTSVVTPTRAGTTSSDDTATNKYAFFPAPTSNPSTPISGGGPVDYKYLLRAPGRHVHLAIPQSRDNTAVQDDEVLSGKDADSGANSGGVIARLRHPRFKPVRHRTVSTPVDDPSVAVDNTTTVNAMAGIRAPPPRVTSISGAAILPEHFQIFMDPTGELGVEGPPGVHSKAKKSRSKNMRTVRQDENILPLFYRA
jgi:hypothetical protein